MLLKNVRQSIIGILSETKKLSALVRLRHTFNYKCVKKKIEKKAVPGHALGSRTRDPSSS